GDVAEAADELATVAGQHDGDGQQDPANEVQYVTGLGDGQPHAVGRSNELTESTGAIDGNGHRVYKLALGKSTRYSWLMATLTIINSKVDSTTAALTVFATPAGPPRVS